MRGLTPSGSWGRVAALIDIGHGMECIIPIGGDKDAAVVGSLESVEPAPVIREIGGDQQMDRERRASGNPVKTGKTDIHTLRKEEPDPLDFGLMPGTVDGAEHGGIYFARGQGAVNRQFSGGLETGFHLPFQSGVRESLIHTGLIELMKQSGEIPVSHSFSRWQVVIIAIAEQRKQ